jgi:hypothetical protein
VTLLPLRLLLPVPLLPPLAPKPLTPPRLLLLTQPLLLPAQPPRLPTQSRTLLLLPKQTLKPSRLTPRSNFVSRKGSNTSERPAQAGLSFLSPRKLGILVDCEDK